MAHMQKSTKVNSVNLVRHFERNETIQEYSNKNIDHTRTHLNYNLAPEREISQYEFIKQRCSEVKCLKRDDVKVMCTWVVTLPKDIEQNSAEEKKFFEETYKFLENRYGGSQNVISAYVHKDEVTPHMHFAFVPVAHDMKKNIDKVSAKEVITRNDLKTFHSDLNDYIAYKLGREVEILNEATKAGNKTVKELKKETALEELNKLKIELKQKSKELNDLKNEISILNKLEKDIDDVEKINYKNNKFSSKVSIEEKDFNNLKANLISVKKENLELKSINIKNKSEIYDLKLAIKGQELKLNDLEKSLKEKIYKLNEKNMSVETLNYNYKSIINAIEKNEKVTEYVWTKMINEIYKENKIEEKNIITSNKIDERLSKKIDDLKIKIDKKELSNQLKNIFEEKEIYSAKEIDKIFLENCFTNIEKFKINILLERQKKILESEIKMDFKNKSIKNQILNNKKIIQCLKKEFKPEFDIQDRLLNKNNTIKNTHKNSVDFDM